MQATSAAPLLPPQRRHRLHRPLHHRLDPVPQRLELALHLQRLQPDPRRVPLHCDLHPRHRDADAVQAFEFFGFEVFDWYVFFFFLFGDGIGVGVGGVGLSFDCGLGLHWIGGAGFGGFGGEFGAGDGGDVGAELRFEEEAETGEALFGGGVGVGVAFAVVVMVRL